MKQYTAFSNSIHAIIPVPACVSRWVLASAPKRAAIILALLLPAFSSLAAFQSVDGFESYTSTAQLQAAWTPSAGTPTVSLDTSTACEGTQSMALTYSGATSPFTNLVRYTFGANQNWATNTTFEFNYGGADNSNDTVVVRLLDQSGTVLTSTNIIGGTVSSPCSVGTINLAGVPGIQAVRSIELGVIGNAADHTGTVHFDDLKVGDLAVLSVLGSSVAKGYIASGVAANQLINDSYLGSYAANLTTSQASNGWRVVNQSIGGDTTIKVINRFYTDEVPVHADQDLIALSLGNEGLAGAANPQAIYDQFFTGITNLIAMSRSNNIVPLIGNQYPKDAYSPGEYVYLKRMDLQQNTLDVPSVNFLGATDDGTGHWINNSFVNMGAGDGIHPNDAGHLEMFLTIVPSVFEAVREGKPTPQWGSRSRYLRVTGDAGQSAPLSLDASLMHSFSVSFRVRATSTGTVASITLPTGSVHPTVEITAEGIAYVGTNGVVNNSGISGTNGTWHDVVVAHQYGRGLTFFYVDGVLITTVAERLTPVNFVLGGRGNASTRPASPAQADYQDWFVHRSMMNQEEVDAQYQGKLQQASLELYAPLDDASFTQGGTVSNRAQSLSVATVNTPTANVTSVPAYTPPSNMTVSSNNTPSVMLNWVDPGSASEDAYYVERRIADGAWTNIATLAAHATSYTDLTVGTGTNYQYRVSYAYAGLHSDYLVSEPVMITPVFPIDPDAILIDLGRHDGGVNGEVTVSPDAYGHYWNNMGTSAATVPQNLFITNLVSVSNSPTTVALTVLSSTLQDNGTQNGGLTTPDLLLLQNFAVRTATEDYFFVNGTAATGTIRVSGLDPAKKYNFSMFATRYTSASDTRTTKYSVTDVNGLHTLNLQTSGPGAGSAEYPYGNNDTIVTLNGLVPNASGQLDLVVTEVNGSFAYLGILEITPSSDKPAFVENPRSTIAPAGTQVSLTARAVSSLPISYQWYFTNSPIAGATSTNYVIPSLSASDVGDYFVVAANAQGSTTSSVANVNIGPDHLPSSSVLIDFSRDDGAQGNDTASPDANGNYWNNIATTTGTVPQGLGITNVVTVGNSPTTIGLTVMSSTFMNNGINNGGLLSPNYALLGDYAIPTATEDYFFVQGTAATGTIRLSGLDPGKRYKLRMFATRNTDAGTTRTTMYSVTDSNGVHSVNLQTSGPGSGSTNYPYGNDDTIVQLNSLVPNSSGQLDLSVTEVNGSFAYLGILEISPADELPAFVQNPQSVEAAPGESTTLSAYAVSLQPVSYQWYFEGDAILGATSTNLSLPNLNITNAGNYFVTASNSVGVVTSSVATILIGPPHLPTSSVLVDFSRDDGAQGNDTASPDVNGNYWNNVATTTGTVPQNLAINNLVTIANSPTSLGLTITSDNFQNNGINNGGLLSPHYGLLGDFAIATATQDYFFLNGTAVTGTMRISGLDPARKYNFSMFGTRNTSSTDTRTTMYSVTDVNGLHSVNLQTSGPGSGSASYPYGNDDTIVSLNNLVPDGSGNVDLSVTVVNGSFAYIGVLQIVPTAETSFTAPTPISGGWQLNFTGTPGYSYHVQRAPEITGPWTDLGVVVAPDNGQISFADTNAPSARAFYRTLIP